MENKIKASTIIQSVIICFVFIILIFSISSLIKSHQQPITKQIISDNRINTICNDNDNRLSAYSCLNDEDKELYKSIVKAINTFDNFTYRSYDDKAEVKKKINNITEYYVLADFPEIFWYTNNFNLYQGDSGKYLVEPVYSTSFEEAEKYFSQIEKLTKAITDDKKITNTPDNYEKAVACFCAVCEQLDAEPGYKNIDDSIDDGIWNAVITNKTSNYGYAKLLGYALSRINIPCSIITGTDIYGNKQMWNIAEIDGKSFYIDAYCADSKNGILYEYFAQTDDDLNKLHIKSENTPPFPECNNQEMNYLIKNGLYIDDINEDELLSAIVKCINMNINPVQIYTQSRDDLESAKEIYKSSTEISEMLEASQKNRKLGNPYSLRLLENNTSDVFYLSY